jgi:hypothetical protein
VTIVAIIGIVGLVVGGLWLVVIAFQESFLWGLACLVIPFANLYFVITRWHKTKTPFLIWLAGFILMVIGSALVSSEAG